MKDNLEIIRHNVACGKEASKKVTYAREGWEAITEQYEWLIAEVDRLRKIEDAAIPWARGDMHHVAHTIKLKRVVKANPRPEDAS